MKTTNSLVSSSTDAENGWISLYNDQIDLKENGSKWAEDVNAILYTMENENNIWKYILNSM